MYIISCIDKSKTIIASIWKAVLYFDKTNTSKILFLEPKNSLIPETRISLVIIKILGMPMRNPYLLLNTNVKKHKIKITSNLSAIGSNILPSLDVWLYFLAIKPSKQSVIEQKIKIQQQSQCRISLKSTYNHDNEN